MIIPVEKLQILELYLIWLLDFHPQKKSKKLEGMEKREPLYTVGGNVSWYSHYGEQYGGSSKS